MQEAIEGTFSGRKKDDLVLLFFSGHGVKDSNGKLYLATALTKKTERGDLVKSTAVSASFIHDIMKDSRSKRKVVILDCCFSGAFAHGLSAKDDGTVDLKSQLGGEGCAVLTSSSSVQYSFEQQGEELSVYTRYLVEGIQTGAADLGSDGYISVDELHEYAQSKVHEESPSMNPKIYALEEGYKIQLLEAVAPDPLLKYQRAVEQCAVAGEISPVWRITLDEMRTRLQLSADEADLVETRVLRPYREYRKKLQRYESVFKTAIQQGFPVKESVRAALKQLQRTLALRNEDILAIEEKWEKWAESKLSKPTAIPQTQKFQQPIASSPPVAGTPLPKSVQAVPENHIESQQTSTNMSSTDTSSTQNTRKLWIGAGIAAAFALATGAGVFAWVFKQPAVFSNERSIPEILLDSPDLIVREECERLKDAYEAGDGRVMSALEASSPVGQKCSGLGFSIAAAEPDERSFPELIASPELLTPEHCQRLKDAYDQGETFAVNSLGENPSNTQVGQKCSALGEAIAAVVESTSPGDSPNTGSSPEDLPIDPTPIDPTPIDPTPIDPTPIDP
ncbi:MAG: caspase family protein, partial [Kangiellaceae bacterium]|nr:caspase family protein [Kangiellaceae bacterium]